MTNTQSPPPLPQANQQSRKKGAGRKRILVVGGVFVCVLLILMAIGESGVRKSKAEIENADKYWLEGKHAAAISIYIDELDYVDESDLAEVYRRIISGLYDRGDKDGAHRYCYMAVQNGIKVEFAREELRKVFDGMNQGVAHLRRAESTKRLETTLPTYELIHREDLLDIKQSLDIRITELSSKLPDSEQLEKLSKKLYADYDGQKYERTFISYYLPGMVIDSGAWATGHYNPDLEIRFTGFTPTLSLEGKRGRTELHKVSLVVGMAYSDVCDKIGWEGIGRGSLSGPDGSKTTKYEWDDEEGTLVAAFRDGALTKWDYEVREIQMSETMNAGSLDLAGSLTVGQTVTLLKQVPLMPALEPGPDPLDSVQQIKQLPPGTLITVLAVSNIHSAPWYEVRAASETGDNIGSGWINSVALR